MMFGSAMHPVGTGNILQMYFKCDVPQNSRCVLIVEDSTESHCAVSHVHMPTGEVSVTVCSLPCSTFGSPLVG